MVAAWALAGVAGIGLATVAAVAWRRRRRLRVQVLPDDAVVLPERMGGGRVAVGGAQPVRLHEDTCALRRHGPHAWTPATWADGEVVARCADCLVARRADPRPPGGAPAQEGAFEVVGGLSAPVGRTFSAGDEVEMGCTLANRGDARRAFLLELENLEDELQASNLRTVPAGWLLEPGSCRFTVFAWTATPTGRDGVVRLRARVRDTTDGRVVTEREFVLPVKPWAS